jgi:hypothetical protein
VSKEDPLVELAETLVQAANANAITAFIPTLDRFPALKRVDTQQWDFFITIAGVFIAATRLVNLRCEKSREEALLQKVTENYVAMSGNGLMSPGLGRHEGRPRMGYPTCKWNKHQVSGQLPGG